MTVAEDILTLLASRPDGLADSDLARLLGKRHQHVNQVCRQLAAGGRIRRAERGGQIVNRSVSGLPSAPPRQRAAEYGNLRVSLSNRAWDWEGNVQATLCHWLSHTGWYLVQIADTATRQRGTDIIAEPHGQRLHVEVKGYPSTTYADPRRAGEVKPTQPTLQARHWYADALLSTVRLRERHPDDRVAMALPDRPRYRALVRETQGALRRLSIEIYMVGEDGTVTETTRGTGDDAA